MFLLLLSSSDVESEPRIKGMSGFWLGLVIWLYLSKVLSMRVVWFEGRGFLIAYR